MIALRRAGPTGMSVDHLHSALFYQMNNDIEERLLLLTWAVGGLSCCYRHGVQ